MLSLLVLGQLEWYVAFEPRFWDCTEQKLVKSYAAALVQHLERLNLTVIERANVTDGQATSISLDQQKYGSTTESKGARQ